MNYDKINKIKTDGNGNLILQDVSGSNITININVSEIAKNNDKIVLLSKKIMNLQTNRNVSQKNKKIKEDEANTNKNIYNGFLKVKKEKIDLDLLSREIELEGQLVHKLLDELQTEIVKISNGRGTNIEKVGILSQRSSEAAAKYKTKLDDNIIRLTSEIPNFSSNIDFASGNYSMKDLETEQKRLEKKIIKENEYLKNNKAELLSNIDEYDKILKKQEKDMSELKKMMTFLEDSETKINSTEQREYFYELKSTVSSLITEQEAIISNAKINFNELKLINDVLLNDIK